MKRLLLVATMLCNAVCPERAITSPFAVSYLGRGPRCDAPPPVWPDHEKCLRRLYMKRCVFVVFQQELQNSTMFDGLFPTDTICD